MNINIHPTGWAAEESPLPESEETMRNERFNITGALLGQIDVELRLFVNDERRVAIRSRNRGGWFLCGWLEDEFIYTGVNRGLMDMLAEGVIPRLWQFDLDSENLARSPYRIELREVIA